MFRVRGISTSSTSNREIRHGFTPTFTGFRNSSRPTIPSNLKPSRQDQTLLSKRHITILPTGLSSTELPQAETQIIETSSTIGNEISVSGTDEALTPVSTIFDFIVNPLSQTLIDIQHPFGYGISIIILTLLVRTTFTLPISIWQRKRILKQKILVEPELKLKNEFIAKNVAKDFRKMGKSYDEYLLEVRKQVAKAQKELHKKHSTHPFITQWSPLLIHIPIFVTLSLTIRRTLEISNSPFSQESFLWLNHLGDLDPYQILPLLGSFLAFGNAELVGRKQKSPESEAQAQTDITKKSQSSSDSDLIHIPASYKLQPQKQKPKPQQPTGPPPPPSGLFANKSSLSTKSSQSRRLSTTSQLDASRNRQYIPKNNSTTTTNPLVDVPVTSDQRQSSFSPARQQEIRRSFMAGILRFSAVGFGLIASQMPAGVTLYWVTSIAFSFVQNLALSWWPQRKAEKERLKKLAESQDEKVVVGGSTSV
ncbi:uncharacterized protein L201_001003 [Kwoniella dendrophila CBS 6074]|uniref:Preprotein translocase subunit YidC n=1 Tax=Kwoniella dendrophila CBS 6074 TaxID=1295534 RepID=A0AAX4JL50_9TREE